MEPETFAEVPVSLSEARAEREGSFKHMAPRDVLVQMLRAIDRGELKPVTVLVVFKTEPKENMVLCGLRRSGGVTIYEQVGLLHTAAHDLLAAT
jgi:hypothetical protein